MSRSDARSDQPRGLARTVLTLVAGALVLGVLAVGVLLFWPAEPTSAPAASPGDIGSSTPAPSGSATTEAMPGAPTTGPYADPDEGATDDWPAEFPDGTLPPSTHQPSSPQDVAAISTAEAFATAFARRPSDQEAAWFEGIKPFLTSQSRQDYLGSDPVTVGYQQVTGPGALAVLHGEEAGYLSDVLIPTDQGEWTVRLQLDERYPSGWAVQRIDPPLDQA